MSTQLYNANREWATRPADQRFFTLPALAASVRSRRERSRSKDVSTAKFQTLDEGDDQIGLRWNGETVHPTNWSFQQYASLAGAPAAYMRKLPAALAVNCLNHGLQKRDVEDVKVMLVDQEGGDGDATLQAVTGVQYGRIWDADVVEACEKIIELSGGRFFNPKDWSGMPSGLYASDRDCFLFFIDGGSMVDGGSERDQLHRGFFVWNSEVGARSFGLSTFLFRQVCGNHIIWGAENVTEFRLRHSIGAPDRFAREAAPLLERYAESSTAGIEAAIQNAKARLLPAPGRADEDLLKWFKAAGFNGAEAKGAIRKARSEEGQLRNVWEAVQGLTAHAREIEWMDSRLDLERRAGRLLAA